MVPLFFLETAFLLSDAHVTAMLQCLEAVEQNNPRLLAQIDASMVKGAKDCPCLSWPLHFTVMCMPREPMTSSLRQLCADRLSFYNACEELGVVGCACCLHLLSIAVTKHLDLEQMLGREEFIWFIHPE